MIWSGGFLSGGVLSWLYVLTHPKVSRVGHWVSESITAMIWEKVKKYRFYIDDLAYLLCSNWLESRDESFKLS